MKKSIVAFVLATTLTGLTGLTGCMGQMGVSGEVRRVNLEVTDHRWGREAVFLGLYIIPVYPIAGAIDLLIVNSIEFWTGTNPVTGKSPAVVDMKVSMLERHGVMNVASAQMEFFPDQRIEMRLLFEDGTKELLSAEKDEGFYRFYRGDELLAEISEDQLKDYQAALRTQMIYARAQENVGRS